jgi:hypothetical protein
MGTVPFPFFPQDGSNSFMYVSFPRKNERERESSSSSPLLLQGKEFNLRSDLGENKDFYIWTTASDSGAFWPEGNSSPNNT